MAPTAMATTSTRRPSIVPAMAPADIFPPLLALTTGGEEPME